jgi:hypothetical protein
MAKLYEAAIPRPVFNTLYKIKRADHDWIFFRLWKDATQGLVAKRKDPL